VGLVALADFGSTYTKVSLVDPEEGRLVARAEAPTSIGSDLMEGYAAALASAVSASGERAPIDEQLAASSAGGGLRVAAVGLVAELTATAARQTALNAGARVGCVLAGALDAEKLEALEDARPEIVLFAGGTDGGQAELVLENARRLAGHGIDAAVVVACNTEIAGEVSEILGEGGALVEVAGNVMPALGTIEVESARSAILRLFLEHVIGGKGLSASPEFGRMVKMPTPEAVYEATRLLAGGTAAEDGIGEVVVIDVGGATTDVHSHRSVEAASPGIEDPLLPPPATLRTVEGDLGLRAGAEGAYAVDRDWIASGSGLEEAAIRHAVSERARNPEWIPGAPEEARLDGLLAVSCAAQAVRRHCGTMLLTRGEGGPPTLRRDGADLREVGLVLGTGGVFAHRDDGGRILEQALERRAPRSLAPQEPRPAVDANYVLAAAGVLASVDRDAAWRLLKRNLLASENETK
jgi:uncharacterized protein (TIGR01319 family)